MASDAEQFVRSLAESWTGFGGGEKLMEVLAEYDRLKAIERRLEETTTWCGEYGMHRAVEYIRTGVTGRALLGSATPTPPAAPGYQRVADTPCHRCGNPIMDDVLWGVCAHCFTAVEAEIAADADPTPPVPRCDSDDINECSCHGQNVEENR